MDATHDGEPVSTPDTSDWRVVGFHGSELRSPALHGPVVVDGDGFMVNEALADRVRVPDDGPLPGFGTRIGPWPNVAGNVVLVADHWELSEADRAVLDRSSLTPNASAFLSATTRDNAEAMWMCHAQRLRYANAGFVAWYAAPADVDSVRALLRDVARERLRAALPILPDATLQDVAWRFQRAATTPDDEIEALAALRVAGVPAKEADELLAELARDMPLRERKRRFAVALRAATVARHPVSNETRLDVLEKRYAALIKEHDALKKRVDELERRALAIPHRREGY